MDIRQQVRDFIVQNFFVADASSLADDDLLLDLGIVDSTGVLEIIRFVEETFGLRLDDADIVPENLGSVARIAGFVAGHKGTPRPAVGHGTVQAVSWTVSTESVVV
jgi:acyl carrier protein